jgi:hypothetical protein
MTGQNHPHFCESCERAWVCDARHPACARPWMSPHPGDHGRVHERRR